MAKERSNNALQIIFSFFLGLMVLALVGVGVNTFYPSPQSQVDDELQKLQRENESLYNKSGQPMTPANEARSKELDKQINAINDRINQEMKTWARNTSIVLIIFATIVMSISLVRSEQLRVISNGLLLGGLFTMVYGSGWVIFSGESTARFAVIVFAFVVTIGLGYLKFVRNREELEAGRVATVLSGDATDTSALAALVARVESLESRNAAAAAALGAREDDRQR